MVELKRIEEWMMKMKELENDPWWYMGLKYPVIGEHSSPETWKFGDSRTMLGDIKSSFESVPPYYKMEFKF